MTAPRIMSVSLALALAAPAAAAVVDAQSGGFQVRSTAAVSAPPDQVYKALVDVGAWWDKEHTFSGDAKNMTLDARAGGCFCEALPNGGSVQHLTVVYADPGHALRLRGALGPLQPMGVQGAMEWVIAPTAGGSKVQLTYSVGGYGPGGLSALATPVDQVLTVQLGRLKAYVETGKPTP